MSFEAKNDFVYELFNRKVYYIPRNQRKYVWEKRNWKELFDDIDIAANIKKPSHFIGSIVLKDEGRKKGIPTYNIIDGQQRIITLTIFLTSIMYLLKKEEMIEDFNGTKQYVFAKDDKDKEIIMVSLETYASFEYIINQIVKTPPSDMQNTSSASFFGELLLDHQKDKNIADAFIAYTTYINEKMQLSTDQKQYLINIRDALLKTSYVSIIATSEEDSYTIFEILNARGLELEDYELLKNYIMRYLQPEGDRDKAKELWSNIENKLGKNMAKFIKHYAVHKYGYDENDRSSYKMIQSKSKGTNTQELLIDIIKKSEYYLKLVNPIESGGEKNCSPLEYKIYYFFKRKRQEQMRPILLSLISQTNTGKLSKAKYEKAISYLYKFFICYNLIGKENSNRIADTIYKYANKIENSYTDELLDEFLASLHKKLPPKENFINAFKDIGWSNHSKYFSGSKEKERVKIVLEIYEHYIAGKCDDLFTVEHVNPDSHDLLNGRIGNLIPLEEKLNDKCKDKDISAKADIYSDSGYKSARDLSKRIKLNQFDIDKRTEKLAEIFYDKILNFS